MNVISKIGLGTVQFGMNYGISNTAGQTTESEVKRILEIAVENRIDLLDTASSYGNAESILGKVHGNNFRIVSKFLPATNAVSLSDQLRSSLDKLQVSSLYGYLSHRPQDVIDNPGQWRQIEEMKTRGFVNKIGFSFNHPEEVENIATLGITPDLIQVPYNYFDRRFETIIRDFANAGCEIHTRSAFLQGLFFLSPAELHPFFNDITEPLRKLQSSTDNLSGALLAFVLQNKWIQKAIVGVESSKHLIQNLDAIRSTSPLPSLDVQIPERILAPSQWPALKK